MSPAGDIFLSEVFKCAILLLICPWMIIQNFMRYFLVVLLVVGLLAPTSSFAATKAPSKPQIPDTFIGPVFGTKTKSYALLDADGDVVIGKNTDEVRSIASLTKLMTAMVLLDEGVDFEKNVAYNPKAHYAYRNYMNFATGDTINNRDSWYSLLTGSMNIPARMLVSSLGFSDAQFIEKMNVKARELGLTHTRFYDVSGLDPRNTSTSFEVGQMLTHALAYPEIKDGLSTKYYQFDEVVSKNKQIHHQFPHTNTLLTKKNLPFSIIAGKTGYIEEAGPCIAMLIMTDEGKTYTLVTLGEVDYYKRYTEIPKLISWFDTTFLDNDLAIRW